MENQRKKRKLMSSRSVPGAGAGVAVVGCGVLINAGSVGVGVDVENGDGGGGGGGGGGSSGGGVVGGRSGGVGRGVGAMAAVRGRTLTRTGQRASQDIRNRITVTTRQQHQQQQPSSSSLSTATSTLTTDAVRGPDNFALPKAPAPVRRANNHNTRKNLNNNNNHHHHQPARNNRKDQDKENSQSAAVTTGTNQKSFKRSREKEGDGPYGDLPKAERNSRPEKVTGLRMAKNAGESRIPLPGSIRSSFLPKPKILTQQKVTAGIENLATPHNSGNRGSVKSLVDSLNLADKRREIVTSTPFVGGKSHKESFPCSPVDDVSCEDVGKTVCVGSAKIGVLRYYGALEGESGPWCGIELPQPDGLNDGTVRGLKYFSCPDNHGIMAPAAKVRRVFSDGFAPQQNVFTMTPLLETTELQVTNDKAIVSNSTFVTGQSALRNGELICRMPGQLEPSSGLPAANSTFLLERNDRQDVDFDQGGDWKFCLKSTPNTSPVQISNHHKNSTVCILGPGEKNDDKITNETTRVLDDKNKRNSALISNGDNRLRLESERSKSPSPTSRTKIPLGSRLVSPTIYTKPSTGSTNSPNAKNADPNLTSTIVKSKVTSQDAGTPKSSNSNVNAQVLSSTFSKRNSTSPTNNEAKKSLAKITESKSSSEVKENGEKSVNDSMSKSSTTKTNVTYRQEDRKGAEVAVDLSKSPSVNATMTIAPAPKPTGAIFKLNESFINEKPVNGNHAALNLTTILYGDRSPVAEIPFAKKLTYFCGKGLQSGESGERITPANLTFDKLNVVADLPSINAKRNSEIRTLKDSDGTFLVEKKAGHGQVEFIKGSGNPENHTNDTFLIAGKRNTDASTPEHGNGNNNTFVFGGEKQTENRVDATFSIGNNKEGEENVAIGKLDDTFFVRSADRRSAILSGSGKIFANIGRESIVELPSPFNESKLGSRIESIGDSCLMDTISTTINDADETGNFEHCQNSSVRHSVDRFIARAFQDSKTSLIDNVGDSCLVDTTLMAGIDANESSELEDCLNATIKPAIGPRGTSQNLKPCGKVDSDKVDLPSGPYSLMGLNGTEEEDELTPPAAPPPSKATPAPHYLMLNKQNSFEHDESLGILTPDQMAEFSMALECSRTPSCENLTGSGGSRIAMTRASASRPSDLPTSVDCEPTEGSSERTPSPEDLPLDPKPAEPTRTVPVSFITSVTSITSLEAGYQGDGENSRPASRGADPAPVAPPPNLPAPRNDPMTDSDFFTESDADAHEEIGRGDRRAQVIDGTLFCAPGGRRCPSFTGEEMDSSGIYSDLDRRQDDLVQEEGPQSEGLTPDTADTESQKSQPSPHQQDNLPIQQQQQQQPVIMECLQLPSSNLDTSADSNTSAGTMEATVIEVEREADPPAKVSNKPDPVPWKKYKMPKRNVVSKIKAMIESGPKDESEKEARRPQRTPRKGGRWDAVMSKIEAGKNEQRTRPARKEVKSRVLQSLGPPPSTTTRRSPGDSNKSKSRRTRGRQDVISPTQETAQSSVHSSMSDISSAPRSAKKRLGSPGGSEGSAQSTPRISSPRQQQPPSSLTIVNNPISSGNVNNNNTSSNVPSSNGTNNVNGNNNNNNNQRENSTRPIPSHSQRSPTAGNPPRRPVNGRTTAQQSRINNSESKKNSLDVSRVNLEKSPSAARKPAVPRRSTSNVAPIKSQSVSPPKDRGIKETTPAPRGVQIETREQSHQTDPTHEEIHLKQAEVSVQALSVIVQYLAHQLDGFSAPRLKKDCERMKTEWLETRLEAEELRAGYRRVEQQLTEQHEERQRALDQLRAELESRHANRLTELETTLHEERQKCEARLQDTLNSSNKELQITIARLRTEHEADLMRKEAETDRRSAVHDQGAALRAEAESLRTVLELRSQEIAALRAENDNLRREVETKEALEAKVVALEARSEDLKAQLQRKETFERQLSHENKVLLESFHQESKQNKRLSQHNEELQWRLRQNNEVVTVLANQLATPPQRLTRSLGPEHTSHSQSPEDSPPASPMVKSMVEKSDSVSWTLEIEESPEAMASRLLRRSGSSRGISPSDSRPKRARQPSSSSPVTSTSVSRQSSLRTTTPQRAVVLRARSKSVSVADAVPQESWSSPGFTSTPSAVRRRPRSDPAGSPAVVAVQDTSQSLRPQEAGGEAMISEETSASSSEDESSASSDIPRLAMELSWSESEG